MKQDTDVLLISCRLFLQGAAASRIPVESPPGEGHERPTMSTPLTPAATALAAHKFTLSVYQGYMLPNKGVETTLGTMLGADHIAWICEQPFPAGTAGSRARGMWDCNNLEMLATYKELERLLKTA